MAPPLRMLVGELRTLMWPGRRGAVPSRAKRPRPVMLLPGFGTGPRRMRRLERALAAAGHTPYPWGLGLNLGATALNVEALMQRVAALARTHGEPVALVGWSMGGLFAREIARRRPELVACVITMGTPFSGDLHANNAWRAYELITGHAVDKPPIECDFATKPPVPTIALWSLRDGIVHPDASKGKPGERDRAVMVDCTHLGFASAPEAVSEVLRQLDSVD